MKVDLPINNSVNSVGYDREKIDLVKPSTISKESEAEKVDEAGKAVYGDVLAVSENGDTVTARKEALQALDDGMVVNKTTEESEEDVDSLTGYSKDELKTLYQKGTINKFKYDQEIERRERLEGEDKVSTVDSVENSADVNAAKESAEFVNSEDSQGSKEATGNVREKITSETTDDKKTYLEEEIENMNKTNEQLGKMVEIEQNVQLRDDAMAKAIEAGRADLMQQIFDGKQ